MRLLDQPLRLPSQKLLQQRTVLPSVSVNFGVACLAGIVLLSFSCDLNTAGDARDIAPGSAATRAASDFAGSSVCGVAGKMAGVDGADSSWRHRGAVGVAGSGASVGAAVKAVSRPAVDEIAGSVAGNATDEEVGESAQAGMQVALQSELQ